MEGTVYVEEGGLYENSLPLTPHWDGEITPTEEKEGASMWTAMGQPGLEVADTPILEDSSCPLKVQRALLPFPQRLWLDTEQPVAWI